MLNQIKCFKAIMLNMAVGVQQRSRYSRIKMDLHSFRAQDFMEKENKTALIPRFVIRYIKVKLQAAGNASRRTSQGGLSSKAEQKQEVGKRQMGGQA